MFGELPNLLILDGEDKNGQLVEDLEDDLILERVEDDDENGNDDWGDEQLNSEAM